MTQTRKLSLMAMCVALTCVAAYISFPLPFTPGMVTAVTLTFALTAFVLPPKATALAIVAYVLLGAAGLPVFAGGTSGIGKILGPTGGFYIAWPIAYYFVSLFKGKEISFRRYAIAAIVLGIPITYVGGLISMMLIMDLGLKEGLLLAVLPYIPGDILKALAAAFLGVRVNEMLRRMG